MNNPSPGRRALLSLGLLACVSLAATVGWAQPANDDFANAFAITGNSGSTNGNNIGATFEAGEPEAYAGLSADQTVWYTWTAPTNASYTFTIGSSDFDALLAVYTGATLNALTQIGAGFNLVSFGTTPVNAPISVTATAGTTYYIQVDGYPFDGLPNGNFVLSWNAVNLPPPSGDFQFASQATAYKTSMPLYIASESESAAPQDPRGMMHATAGARLTVTRMKGSTGRVLVDYAVTNTFYTNYFITNIFGTNFISTAFYTNFYTNYFVTNTIGTNLFVTNIITTDTIDLSTNVFTTNILVTTRYQNNEYGQWVYLPNQYTLTTIIGSNVTTIVATNLTTIVGTNVTTIGGTNIHPVTQLGITNYPMTNVSPAFTCDNSSIFSSMTTTDTPPETLTFFTNSFCVTTNLTNIVASATPDQDYVPQSGVLTFDDYQMSSDILVSVIPSGNTKFPVLNHVLIATITNVALDPMESQSIPPPTASTAATNAMLNILSQQALVIPYEQFTQHGPPGFGTGVRGTNVFNFERATLRCTENVNGSGVAYVGVLRSTVDNTASISVNYQIDYFYPYSNDNNSFMNTDGTLPDWEVPLQPGSDYAGVVTNTPTGTYSDNVHFTTVSGTLSWGAYDTTTKFIQIPIVNDAVVEFNEDLLLQLWLPGLPYPDASSSCSLGYVQTCNLTILFNTQPAGACDVGYNPDNVPYTDPPYNADPGPNSSVYAIAIQPSDGKAIIGGDFTDYNGIGVVNNEANIFRFARVNTDGSLDQTFNPGLGADQFVSALAIDTNLNVVLGGAFNSINGVVRSRIARVTSNGSLDTTFAPQGADGTVWAVGIDTNTGDILMAGQFTNVNTLPRHGIARLLPNGNLDPLFDPGQGPDGSILAMCVQPNGQIIIGGEFSHVDGVALSKIARLNSDGTLDNTFTPGSGFDGTVYALALQPDGNIVVGGAFQSFNAYPCNFITRLTSSGSIDINFLAGIGTGADDVIYSLLLQPDANILFGGIFKSFNQTRRVGIGRLFSNGTVDTSFMDVAYNQFAGVPNQYWDPSVNPPNFIYAIGLQPDGNVLIAGSFPRVGGGSTRDDIRDKQNFTRLIGNSTPGPGNIGLANQDYSANQTDGQLFITLVRTNGHLGPAAATFNPVTYPTNNGTAGIAIQGEDFTFDSVDYGTPLWLTSYGRVGLTWHLHDGIFGPNNGVDTLGCLSTVNPHLDVCEGNNKVYISLINNPSASGNRQLNLALSNPSDNDQFLLGGQKIPLGVALGQNSAVMTIVNPQTLPGVLGFSSPAYSCSKATNAIITITRTNGDTGPVTVLFQTLNGTGTNMIDYRTNFSRVNFKQGDTSETVVVTNIHNTLLEGDRTVNLLLYNPSGGATLGLTNAVLTIIDDNITNGYVEFSSATYGTNENAGSALITVSRNGGSVGQLSVELSTQDGAATNGFIAATNGYNYLGLTNYTITWNDTISGPQVIAIPLLDDGVVETSPMTVNLQLSSATVKGSPNSTVLTHGITNAVLYITNSDFQGQLSFSTASYNVNDNGGPGYITVVRSGGSAQSLTVNFATLPGTATPGVNYYPTNGFLLFTQGQVSKTFTVPIIDSGNPSSTVMLVLSNASPATALGFPSNAVLNIIDAEVLNQPPGSLDTTEDPSLGFNDSVYALALQADGRLLVGGDFTMANGLSRQRIARLNTDGSLDQTFSSTSPFVGADASVLALICQTDGRIVLGGNFTNIDSVHQSFLARVVNNGAIDTTFNPGAGLDNSVYAVAETFIGPDRKLLVGGAFTLFNSSPCDFITRLNDDGSQDAGFQTGLGANGNVWAIAVQPDGKAVIGGDFTAVNGVTLPHVARLNTDGSVDLTFAPGVGANDSVRAIAVQLDGRIVIGGFFTNFNGVPLNNIARLTAGGAVDSTFTPGLGFNDLVSTIALQPDTRIVVGGQFTLCNGVTRHRLTRFNNDGTLDTEINFGDGANSFVSAVVIETNGLIDLGGGFTQYDDQPVQHLARIYGGTIAGPGAFEFNAANYSVLETTTNATLTVRRQGGTSGVVSNGVYVPNVSVTFATDPGGITTAVLGTNYLGVTNTLVFAPGEVFQNVTIPVIHDFAITPDLVVSNYLWNPMPDVPGGPALGNQPSAVLTIVNVDSGVSFQQATYFYNENAGYAVIPVLRNGSTNGLTTVDFLTTTGTAVPYTNYVPVFTNLTFLDGQVSNVVEVPLVYDPAPQGNTTVTLQLSNAVGSLLLNPSQATLTILDVDQAPGQLLFSQTNYTVNMGSSLPVTILRTNGHSGTVQVNFTTVASNALPGFNYITTNGTLTFSGNQTTQSFTVPTLPVNQVVGNLTFGLLLYDATNGATLLGPTNVPVTIIDTNVGVSFLSQVPTSVSELAGNVSLTLVRQNGTNSVTTVHYSTTNNSALAGVNYVGVTNGTVTFNPGDVYQNLVIGILHDPQVTGDLSFNVNLFNPSAPAQLGAPSSATVIVEDAESGLSIESTNLVTVTNLDLSVTTNASFGVLKSSGTNLLITVIRSNVDNGTVGVGYATADGTALAGVDYVANVGSLTFNQGILTQAVSLQIISNLFIEGNRTFTLYLTNPTPTNVALLLTPYAATVTITDDVAGLSFASPTFSVNKNLQQATITVARGNYTNNDVSVDFFTSDGSGGISYTPTNGTLEFPSRVTAQSFVVHWLDDHVIGGNHTIQLNLSNAVANAGGGAVLVNPATATLLVVDTDGSLVIPAGAALTHESGPVNGVIDPGETVSLLFGLRDANGTNTVNLVATLLATNGVTSPSGPQDYGMLTVGGPSASRPFTFTASGTNGQTINPTFQLQDGSTTLSNAVFSFTLGKTPASYTNNALITINDLDPATPYPSVINVSNLNGLVTQVTATLTNLSHTYPKDIDVLLVSPTGQKTFLMSHCGSSYSANDVTLTFDSTSANVLPFAAPLSSGTYQPTAYGFPPTLPAPVAPFPTNATAPPYATNLSIFNGTSPNGPWALYVYDDTYLNSGSIANGWIINLTLTGPVPGAADLAVGMTASALTNVVTSNLTYSITVTNFGPSTSSNVVATDLLPAGIGLAGANAVQASQGTVTNIAGLVTWQVGSLTNGAFASLSLVVTNSISGLITNSATVSAATTDPNPDDNTASVVTTVNAPTADLALGLADSPDPVLTGFNLTYTLTVSNGGPATATGVTVVDTLPATVNFVSALPPNSYTYAAGVVTFTNLGNLGSGQQATETIVVTPTLPGTLLDSASCSSSVVDPLKANNHAAVKTIVQAGSLTVSLVPGGLSLSWPAGGNYILESTTNLHPPAVWTPVTDAVPTVVGGQMTVTVPIGPGNRFFRLVSSAVPMVSLTLSRANANLTLAWPVTSLNFNLESAASLQSPIVWTPVTSPLPLTNNGMITVTLPIGSGRQFFRLSGTTP